VASDNKHAARNAKIERKCKAIVKQRDRNVRKLKTIFIATSTVVVYRQVLDLILSQNPRGDTMQFIVLQRNILNMTLILILCLSIRDTVKTMQKLEDRVSMQNSLKFSQGLDGHLS